MFWWRILKLPSFKTLSSFGGRWNSLESEMSFVGSTHCTEDSNQILRSQSQGILNDSSAHITLQNKPG